MGGRGPGQGQGLQAAGFHRPVQGEVLGTQEGARRTIGLPGEAGPAVEGEMEAFFSRDLSSVLEGNRLDPQVLIQGRLSCKTARAIGTIIIRVPPVRILSHRACSQQWGLAQPLAQPQGQARNRDPGGSSSVSEGCVDSNRHQSTEPI